MITSNLSVATAQVLEHCRAMPQMAAKFQEAHHVTRRSETSVTVDDLTASWGLHRGGGS